MAKAKKSKTAAKSAKKTASKSGETRVGEMLKRTAISRIENHADDIKLSTLERVAKALGKELKVKIL
jgi:HTH-type transcriptional regulator / antitoxin HipB